MTIISDDGKEIWVELPCGTKTVISCEDKWITDIFPYWRKNKHGYVGCARYIKTEYGRAREDYQIQRLIIGIVKGFQVDHVDRDKLNNRRSNLRLATRNENAANKAKSKVMTSKYRGVRFCPKINKKNQWSAQIGGYGKIQHLGYFKTEDDAAKAYDVAMKEKWGEFAFLNFPDQS